jgi:hypothetical protein
MLFFFRRVDVPDGSSLSFTVSGDTQAVGLRAKVSVDGGPSTTLDPGKPLTLSSPKSYAVDFDVVTLASATVAVDVIVTAPDGTPYGTSLHQSITGQPGDLNTIHCDLPTQA